MIQVKKLFKIKNYFIFFKKDMYNFFVRPLVRSQSWKNKDKVQHFFSSSKMAAGAHHLDIRTFGMSTS